MYTQRDKRAGDAYIPSNYRGNALYFEKVPCEDEPEQEKTECEDCCDKPRKCEHECKKSAVPSPFGSLSSLFGKLCSGDNLIILALLGFFLFASKDKGDDNTVLLLILLLLL